MSKTKEIVSTAVAKLGDAKKAFEKADLVGKASRIAGVGAGLAMAKKGGSAAVKTVRKHPVGTAVTAAALAAVGAAVYLAKKKKAGAAAKPAAKAAAKPAPKKLAKPAGPAKKAAVKKAAPKKTAAKKAAK